MSGLRVHRKLWLLAAFCLATAVALSQWMPLQPFYTRNPLPDVRSFSPSLAAGLAYVLLICALFAAMWLAFTTARQKPQPPSLIWIILTTLLIGLPLLNTFPINATDVYRYVIRGRVSSVYDLNPYTTAPSELRRGDPFAALAGEWEDETSPYGPLWELGATAVTTISQDNLLLGLILFKAIGLGLHLAITALLWHLLADRSANIRAGLTLLWAWNPALWFMFIIDAHNDVLMLFWLVLGWAINRHKHPTAGFLVMVLAALTKPIGVLPLPYFWLASLRELPVGAARRRYALFTLLGTAVLVTLAFLPFGSPLDLAQRLVREASGGAGFSPATLLLLINQKANGPLTVPFVNWLGIAGFVLFAGWLAWRTWYGRSPLTAAAAIFIAYTWQALNFRIWYTTWPLAFLLLADGNENGRLSPGQTAGLWLLCFAQISVTIYGHLRVYALNGDHFLAHLIGVPLVFIVPWLLAGWQPQQPSSSHTHPSPTS